MIIGVLQAGIIVLTILRDGSLVALVLVSAFFTIINGGMVILAARYIHGPFRFRRSALRFDRFKSFSGYALSAFASQIADIVRYKSHPLIITPFLGLAALTPFAIAERLSNMIIPYATAYY